MATGNRTIPRLVLLWAALALGACRFDNDDPAPEIPTTGRPACGDTASLFPKLFEFLAADHFSPLRVVVERKLLPTEANPNPDPSLRTVLADLVRLVRQLGLDETTAVAHLATQGEVEAKLTPLLVVILEFLDGRLDGQDHYAVTEAAAHFVDVCDPDDLLSALEDVLRFQSPSRGEPWVVAVFGELKLLLAEPMLAPFLTSFQQSQDTGRPAIIGLVRQIMGFVADDDFTIARVETLIESAVDPLVGASLEARIDRLVALLGEATDRQLGILPSLQGALRCGLRHPAQRDELIGFLYDLAISPSLGLERVLGGLEVIELAAIQSELGLLAEVIKVARTDLTLRDDLRRLISLFLRRPEVGEATPVLIGLLNEGVITELLHGVLTILEGCEP